MKLLFGDDQLFYYSLILPWFLQTAVLSIIGITDVALTSVGVYELVLEQNMIKW